MRTAISPGQWQPWTAVSPSGWSSSAWHSQRVNEINTQRWKKRLALEGVEGRGKGGGCILKIVISKDGKGGTVFVCNYLGGKVLIYHTFLKTPPPPPPGHNIRSAPNVRRSICCNRASRPSADQKCRHSPPSQK